LCHVERRDDIPKFVYDEEEEDAGDGGKAKPAPKKVTLSPRWRATSAELVTDANKGKKAEFVASVKSNSANGNDDLVSVVLKLFSICHKWAGSGHVSFTVCP
jgi:hypothetical protein